MKLSIIKVFCVCLIAGGAFLLLSAPVSAQIPRVEGYVLVEDTNAPVAGVWVRLTNSNSLNTACVPGTIDQSRYARTDSDGKYVFTSWIDDGSGSVGMGVNIDTDLDGINDAVQYPATDSCDPSGSPGVLFSSGRAPFVVDVVVPKGKAGTFSSYGNHIANPCIFCISISTTMQTIPTLYYYSTPPPPLPPPVSTCLVYGVNDIGPGDSQFFTIDPNTKAINVISTHPGYDIEGLAINPVNHVLYASSNHESEYNQSGYLYTINPNDGSISPVGPTGFLSGMGGISFRSTDNTLWGGVWQGGIIRIDVTTGAGTVVNPTSKEWGGAAWSPDGKYLYLSEVDTTNLWRYDPVNNDFGGGPYATNLPSDQVEGLAMTNDGITLLGSIGLPGAADLFLYDTTTKTYVTAPFSASFDDVEPIVWPLSCNYPVNCAVSLTPQGGNILIGETKPLTATVNSPWAVSSVRFEDVASNPSVKMCEYVNPSVSCTTGTSNYTDTASAWMSKVTFNAAGDYGLRATATLSTGGTCSSIIQTYTIQNTRPWWQTAGGDVIVTSPTGRIRSDIPPACATLQNCLPFFSLGDNTGYWNNSSPGVIHAPGGINVVQDGLMPDISTQGWNTNPGSLDSTIYTYQYFRNMSPVENPQVISSEIPLINPTSCDTSSLNYCIYTSSSNPLNLGIVSGPAIDIGTKKVILFASGDVNINAPIKLTNGLGFLMIIAKGKITVDASVGSIIETPVPEPDLEGIFFTEDEFLTTSNIPSSTTYDNPLHIRGTVISTKDNGISLQRNLQNNAQGPAELFEFAPDLFLRYPTFLSKPAIDWNEVQP